MSGARQPPQGLCPSCSHDGLLLLPACTCHGSVPRGTAVTRCGHCGKEHVNRITVEPGTPTARQVPTEPTQSLRDMPARPCSGSTSHKTARQSQPTCPRRTTDTGGVVHPSSGM